MNTDVEDLLREGMERFTADLRAPAGVTRRAAQRLRRRLALRSAATGAAALTAGALALVAVGLPGGRGNSADAAAYVVTRVGSALSAAGPGSIAQLTVTTSGPVLPNGGTATVTAEEWSYGDQWRSVTYSSPGHPVYDEGVSASSVYSLVNYQTRTWARLSGQGRPAPPAVRDTHGCGPVVAALPALFLPGPPGIGFAGSWLPVTGAGALRAAVSCGTLVVAGRQHVNGIEAIELTSRPDSPISETIWVSPGSYLPVRMVVRLGPGHPVLQRTADITWLPPTAQNLAMLTVPVPAGFRHVSFAAAVVPMLRLVPGGLPKFPLAFAKPLAFCPCLPTGPACKAGAAFRALPALPAFLPLTKSRPVVSRLAFLCPGKAPASR